MIREVISPRRLEAMSPDEAAAHWAARRSDGCSSQEDELFREWLHRDEAHAQAWARVERTLRLFDGAGDDEILSAMRERARSAEPHGMMRWPQLAAAAALLFAIGSAIFLGSGGDWAGGPAPEQVARSRAAGAVPGRQLAFATGVGELRTVALPDGSRMILDTQSAVSAEIGRESRKLRLLKGRAFFEVKRDPSRPFSVEAGELSVSALGTRFDVRLDPGQVRVVLVEGRLAVGKRQSGAAPLMMSAGDELLARDGESVVRARADLEQALSWQQGFATFEDDTLSAAAAELNRYSTERLVVRDPAVAALRVTGMFRTGDPERFARALAQVHPVASRRRGKDIEIVAAR
jgi:transmembrane sensor